MKSYHIVQFAAVAEVALRQIIVTEETESSRTVWSALWCIDGNTEAIHLIEILIKSSQYQEVVWLLLNILGTITCIGICKWLIILCQNIVRSTIHIHTVEARTLKIGNLVVNIKVESMLYSPVCLSNDRRCDDIDTILLIRLVGHDQTLVAIPSL